MKKGSSHSFLYTSEKNKGEGSKICSHPDCYKGGEKQKRTEFHGVGKQWLASWCKKCYSKYQHSKQKERLEAYWKAAKGVWWLYQYFVSSDKELARARRK